MVGVPKSKGCETCRRRSIKCDEARPNCSQCRRGGRKCPGYHRAMKFVDESVNLRFKTRAVGAPRLDYQHPSHTSIERAQIVSSFVQDLFPINTGSMQKSFIGGWLRLVPSVLHHHPALDLAAECLAAIYFAKKSLSIDILMRSYVSYSRALETLSKSLQHPTHCLSSETLCATLLLVHYERFASMQSASWITHASGIGRLIKLRGPDRHRSGIDRAILMASRGYIISEAVVNGTNCFLADEGWQQIKTVDSSSPLIPRNAIIYHEGLNYFARVPGLLRESSAFDICSSSSKQLQELYSAANQLRLDLMAWYSTTGAASKRVLRLVPKDEDTSDQAGSAAYNYDDPIIAGFTVHYSAYLILINITLDKLTGLNMHLEENKTLATDIGLSAFYCSKTGFCGASAMKLALPVALLAASEEDSSGLRYWLDSFNESRAPIKLWYTISKDQ